MVFVKYDTMSAWFEYRDKNLYNVDGSFWGEELCEPHKKYSKRLECPDWHHLYLATGYVPSSMYDVTEARDVKDWWVRDDGLDIVGDAREIAIYLCGIDTPVAEEWLEAMGWVRVRNDASWCREQKKKGYYKNVTPQQYDRIETIAIAMDIYPENLLDWNGTYA
jgi:hypothetical protein